MACSDNGMLIWPEENSCYFANNIFRYILWKGICCMGPKQIVSHNPVYNIFNIYILLGSLHTYINTCIYMASSKTAVTPLLMHWSYCSLALSHWYNVWWNSWAHSGLVIIWNILLAQFMAWCWSGYKSLHVPMLTKICDVVLWYQATMS